MKKIFRDLFFPILLLLAFFFFTRPADAQSINYHTYKYGTRQTSMADGYYARPAQVVADGKQYLVTMTIRTKKNLSPYPVKVLSIDGQAPLNIVKARHGTDYDYRYSFRTSNLNRIISSKISIDVPKVYKATHDISFGFDTKNLPKLGNSNKKKISKNVPVKKHDDSSNEKVETKTNNENTVDPQALVAQAQKQSSQAKQKQEALAQQQMTQNSKNQLENERNQKMFYYTILGGILSLIVLIVAAIFFVISAKTSRDAKGK